MLIKAASKELDIPFENLNTDKGIIFDKSKKIKKLIYGEIASKAVDIKVPEDLNLCDHQVHFININLLVLQKRMLIGPKIVNWRLGLFH